MKQLTQEEFVIKFDNKIKQLEKEGYSWSPKLSASYSAVVLSKKDDIYVFGLDGTMKHNPNAIVVKL